MNDLRDAWTDRLSDYVDGELDAAEHAALEVHLQICARCARTVEELRDVVQRAATLEAQPPAQDLWPAIAARLEPRRARILDLGRWLGERGTTRSRAYPVAAPRRWSFTLPQLAAAAVLLVMLSSVTMWVALSRRPVATPPAPGLAPTAPAVAQVEPAGFEAARYDAAIADLEQVLREHRSDLDSSTVRVIEENLRIIDQATMQARKALAADPANPYLNGHLATQLKRKMTLLRQATAVVAAHSG